MHIGAHDTRGMEERESNWALVLTPPLNGIQELATELGGLRLVQQVLLQLKHLASPKSSTFKVDWRDTIVEMWVHEADMIGQNNIFFKEIER